jgi:hypothetical protein
LSCVFYLGFARVRVKRLFFISNISAGKVMCHGKNVARELRVGLACHRLCPDVWTAKSRVRPAINTRISQSELHNIKIKGKAFPLQAWRVPWSSRRLRLQNI